MTSFAPRFTITHEVTSALTAIERARGFLEAATLSESWVRRMSERALLLEAHHSTHIEGTQLTLEQSERLWAGEQVAAALPDDMRELLNYRDAFHLVAQSLQAGDPVTETLLRGIHARLVEGVRGGQGEPGRYRTTQNFVVNSITREVIYTPPPPHDVAPLMRELVEWLGEESAVHPVLVAGIAQFQLVHIHPFVDGNGRTSRLLSTLCLHRAGYDFRRLFTLSEYYDRDRTAFYRALQGVREREMDLTGWLEFFVRGLSTQLAEVKERGSAAIRAEVVARAHRLGERQAAVLADIFVTGRRTVSELERAFLDVNRRTLQRDLKALITKGLITESGGTNDPHRHYRPAEP